MDKNNIKFISSRNNEFIVEIAKLKDKKYRDKTGLFCIEGVKLFVEALNAVKLGWEIRHIIAAEKIAGEILEILKNTEYAGYIDYIKNTPKDLFVTATDAVYEKISSESAFQGVMCVMRKPHENISLTYKKPVAILDEVRDAGNAGTILRTANALCNCEFIFTQGCADLYNPKTLRAAMGANFYQTIKVCGNDGDIDSEMKKLKENGYNILAAHLDKDSKSIENINFDAKTAVVFGNEGRGVSQDVLKLCDEKMIIPISENSESLNVSTAAGIVFWEMRQFKKRV